MSSPGGVGTSSNGNGVAPMSVDSSSSSITTTPSPGGGGDVVTSNGGGAATTTTKAAKQQPQQAYEALWDFDGPTLDQWVRSIPAIFAAKKPVAVEGSPSTTNGNNASFPPVKQISTLEIANQVWANLQNAVEALQTQVEQSKPKPRNDDDDDDEEEEEEKKLQPPPNKRLKANRDAIKNNKRNKNKRRPKERLILLDPYNLYQHAIRIPEKHDDEDEEEAAERESDVDDAMQDASRELRTTMGGKLTQLTLSGIMNGMAGAQGGLVMNRQCELRPGYNKNQIPISTTLSTTLQQLKALASAMHQAIQTRIEEDVLVTTPIRIQEMMAPELTPSQFKAIRDRVYDTVILGKGMGHDVKEREGMDIPTAASSGVHDVEKFKKCKSCGNNDQSLFVLDRKNGDVICSACGTVASESLMHEGSAYRKFEGEADRNHHGDTANPLYSNAHNMATTLGGVQVTTGAGIGGFGSQKRGLETVLRNAHAYTELNISQFGKGDRRTRIGYKDKQKKDAFFQMTHTGDALNLHEAVVQRAKELFAGFRNDRELVQQFKGVIAACLCIAFDQLSSDGKQILKQKQEDIIAEQEAMNKKVLTSARASRRNEMHHANMAGKGGLLLDTGAQKSQGEVEESMSTVAQKPASTWDLDDCRSWLLEASRSIAQQWIEERRKGVPGIPSGSQEELEGNLVEHAIVLCDALEEELRQAALKNNSGIKNGRGRVVTPRVNDMAKLGIKWQRIRDHGSGTKPVVGGSGIKVKGHNPINHMSKLPPAGGTTGASGGGGGGRKAGQLLFLKTPKKLGLILKDNMAGQAIHKELRSVVGKQEALKRKRQLEEASRQRFAQMQRKPWLQARAQEEAQEKAAAAAATHPTMTSS